MSSRHRSVSVRDRALEDQSDDSALGLSVRVVVDGTWGFASVDEVNPEAATLAASRAVALARYAAPLATDRVELAPEPVHVDEWSSDFEVDPFTVPSAQQAELLLSWTDGLLARGLAHANASVACVRETTHFASLAGSRITQQRTRISPELQGIAVASDGRFDSMASTVPPVARGWEHLTSGWDFASEVERIPEWLTEKLASPGIEPGRYDLVIDPTNLWLTIHESIGHATELDRALGYEANYAGTSFATPDRVGQLQYGSDLMNVVGDRTRRYGLATTGYDDEGVSAQQWDIVRDGRFVGYQLDRAMAHGYGQRSNGCAYADSAQHVPIQRMANVSIAAGREDLTTEDLIAGVTDGIYIVGDRSWSIDMQRYNFQFTGQRFFRIRNGRLAGQVRDVAYQSNTLEFWNSLIAIGGERTWFLGGAVNCGKGQPGQVAPVSHGCPAAVFQGVNILNSAAESAA